MKQGVKGYSPRVDERDISYAFKINKRAEKFNMALSEVDAHTLNIIEIIEEEKANVEQKQNKELERQINNG